jgi:hypothetical protein
MWKPDLLIVNDRHAALADLCQTKWPDLVVHFTNQLPVAPPIEGKTVLVLETPPADWIARQVLGSCIIFYDDADAKPQLERWSADWILKFPVDQIGRVDGCFTQYIEAAAFKDTLTDWLLPVGGPMR